MGEDKYGDGCLGSIVIQHDPGIARDRQIRHLIVHLEKELNWQKIQRKSQIYCKFGERSKLAVLSEKEANYLLIRK